MTDRSLLHGAVDLVPEGWARDIADDAAAQGYHVGFTAAAGGLRTGTIRRAQRHFVEREWDADRHSLSEGQRLDEVFPQYNGIGWPDLLAELGLAAVYVLVPATAGGRAA